MYPGIDGHPPPGSKPLIHGFSLSLSSSHRCLLVGSNGAARADIQKFLKKECEERGATIIYGTRVFDRLRGLANAHCVCASWEAAISDANVETQGNYISHSSGKGPFSNMQRKVQSWLRKEREEEKKKRRQRKASGLPEFEEQMEGSQVTGDPAPAFNNGWAAGRLRSTVAGEENFVFSSNRVSRQ